MGGLPLRSVPFYVHDPGFMDFGMMFAGLYPQRSVKEISLMKNLIYCIGLTAAIATFSTGCATLADARNEKGEGGAGEMLAQ